MSSSIIHFHEEDTSFSYSDSDQCQKWLSLVIQNEEKKLGEINCIFCSDNYLLQINQQYLLHDTYTDIITFNYVSGDCISGDLFISVDRVEDNAKKYNISFNEELNRVLVHGVLHLIGYNDKTEEEALIIRGKEDFYLTLYAKI